MFVPKEVIKQQMQYAGGRKVGHAIKDIVQKYGLRGLYSGYTVCLLLHVRWYGIDRLEN